MRKICLTILLLLVLIYGCSGDINTLKKVAFKLGAAYALKMNQEGAFRNSNTIGEAACLAWETYKSEQFITLK